MKRAAERLGEEYESFPETMQAFETKFGRTEMVRMIKSKFDYVDSFRSLRWNARKFHCELATMPYLEDIVTTNWDTYFEEECQAIPFVSGEDVALWNVAGRKVLKIHGSINNLASIVATEDDYANRLDLMKSNVMGAFLRNLLATHTVVFIGYSLQDWNFRWLYESLLADMGKYAPRAYFVSPFGVSSEDAEKYRLEVIKTSGVNFLRKLKSANFGACFIRDEAYERVGEYSDEIDEAEGYAKSLSHIEYPSVIYCWSFHDGARDACARISFRRGSGEYSSRKYVRDRILTYEKLSERALEKDDFWNHSYIEGYLIPLYLMLDDNPDNNEDDVDVFRMAPRYFAYSAAEDNVLQSQDDFDMAMEDGRRRAPKQRAAARQIMADIPADMVITHEPFLPGLATENPPLENEHRSKRS